jgi:hypothetical protein
MKKLSQYTLIVITSIILPSFSFPSLAKDCPTIPENIKQVTVKSDSASLRKQPTQNSEKGFVILENDRLKVLDPKPAGDKNNQNYCWYQVGSLKDTSRNKYWIAHVGIKEFENFSANISNLSEQNNSNSNQAINFSILIIFIGLGALSISGIVFSLYCVSLFKEYDKQIETLQENLEDSEKKVKNIQNTVEESKQQIVNQFNNQVHLNTQFNQLLEAIKNATQYKLLYISFQLKKIIYEFNNNNKTYFNDPQFELLTLTKESIQGHVGLDARRIIELESCTDNSQASFLKFEMDGENWLFPNITSPYISQIMRNLGEYTEFFIIHPGSEILQLIRPAKLKNIGSNLWGIEELGEFTQQDNIIPEIDLQSFHNLPSQNINSSPTFSSEIINPKEIDIGILYYLRKNDNASFIDLLSNLQYDKQLLRDRLLILQEEKFIKIVNKTDENNTIYKML